MAPTKVSHAFAEALRVLPDPPPSTETRNVKASGMPSYGLVVAATA